MTTIASVCARGGSKGLPGKNTRILAGKPLIVHTIEQAQRCSRISDVYVSTDDPEIARIAQNAGAKVPFLRPADLATDEAPKLPVLRHLLDYLTGSGVACDTLINLDPTSPLRAASDIEACLDLLTAQTDVVITAYPAEKNPYFNMVEPRPEGGYGLSKVLPDKIQRRQDAPPVFAMNASIYVWWAKTLDRGLFGPRTALHVMPRERSIDIDSAIDFRLVEMLLDERMGAA